jgi:hypothetical protein
MRAKAGGHGKSGLFRDGECEDVFRQINPLLFYSERWPGKRRRFFTLNGLASAKRGLWFPVDRNHYRFEPKQPGTNIEHRRRYGSGETEKLLE